ncbi:MAG: GSCFA domain-containing protein, partial [Thermodesulfobacteriota bacterium]
MQEEIKKSEELFLNNRFEEAEALFLKLLEKAPDNAEIMNNLGVLCHSTDRASEAEAYFKRAIESDSHHPDAPVNLASLYQEQKRWQEAAQALEQALKIKEDPGLYNQLGVMALEMGDTALAQKALGRSLEILPDQSEVRESYEALHRIPEPHQSKATGSSPFRASFAEIDITPQLPRNEKILLQGMAGPPRHATGVSTRLMMQMLLMEDKNFTKTLFVTADLFGFGPEITEQVFNSAAQWGIEPEAVFLNSSHTHYAPGTISNCSKAIGPFYKNYADQITKTIVSNIAYLYNNLDNAELFYGMTEVMIGVNRRYKSEDKIIFAPNKAGYYQKDTPFILIQTRYNKYLLVNHGCHPTGLGNHSAISADYISYMRQDLVTSGTVSGVMFMQGAAGSAKEAHETENGDMEFCSSVEDSTTNGLKLASTLKKHLKNNLEPLDGTFFYTTRQAILPLREAPPESVLRRVADDQNADPLARYWAHGVLERFGNSSLPQQIEFNVQFMGIGEKFALISLPGEPVAELARNILDLHGWPEAFFFLGYTNGLVGYLPTDKILEEGGYEAEMSHLAYLLPAPLASKTESNIISSVANCLTAFKDNRTPNGYGRYHLARPKKRSAFFVLSAGRCGTMTLAHLLNTATNAKVWHHPQPDLIMEALFAHRGQIDKKQAFWRARYPIIHKTWAEGLTHGETDHLMTPFCDMIAEEIPESKFIVLVRDPRDFVRSGMRRGYYQSHPWDQGRLRPMQGASEYREWQGLDQFQKICWLWNSTYTLINTFLGTLKKSRFKMILFEELISNPKITKDLFHFLGLTGYDYNKITEIIKRQLNQQMSGDFPSYDKWPAILQQQLWKLCGPLAESYGYEEGFDHQEPRKSTIWDFAYFNHQKYPDKLTANIAKVNNEAEIRIDKNTKLVSMGSCFARNIALELIQRGYNYLIPEKPFSEFSAHWGQVFNTACMRQIFEYTFTEHWMPKERWWPKGSMVQDPFRRNILYDVARCETDFN